LLVLVNGLIMRRVHTFLWINVHLIVIPPTSNKQLKNLLAQKRCTQINPNFKSQHDHKSARKNRRKQENFESHKRPLAPGNMCMHGKVCACVVWIGLRRELGSCMQLWKKRITGVWRSSYRAPAGSWFRPQYGGWARGAGSGWTPQGLHVGVTSGKSDWLPWPRDPGGKIPTVWMTWRGPSSDPIPISVLQPQATALLSLRPRLLRVLLPGNLDLDLDLVELLHVVRQ
jgi:hypothetical protein